MHEGEAGESDESRGTATVSLASQFGSAQCDKILGEQTETSVRSVREFPPFVRAQQSRMPSTSSQTRLEQKLGGAQECG